MAIKLFLLLNAMGIAFLLHTLARFWIEGHQTKGAAQPHELRVSLENRTNVIVITHPISSSAHGGFSVIPIDAMAVNKEEVRNFRREIEKIPLGTTRLSTM